MDTGNQYEHDAENVLVLSYEFTTTSKMLTDMVNSVAVGINNVTRNISEGAAGAEEVAAGANEVSV